MITTHIKVGDKRYREDIGFYFEDFEVGAVFEHRPGRTVSEVDNLWQSLICMNQHPLHIDNHYAQKTEFRKILVSSLVTFSIVSGMSVKSTSAKAIANLGWDNIRLTNPVFVGDTLYAESEIMAVRESKSRPADGIVKIKTTGFKEDGTIILTSERSILVPKRNFGIDYSIEFA